MKYLLFTALLSCFAMNADNSGSASTAPAISSANKNGELKDPVVVKINGRDVKLSEVTPLLISLIGGNINSLSKEQLISAMDMAKKMYVMQDILLKEAKTRNFKSKKEFAPMYQRAEDNTSIEILMREVGKEFSDAQLKKAYPKFIENKKLNDYKFSVIVVQDEQTAKAVLAGLNSGSAFNAIAKERSSHRSADRADNPGLVEFMREDYIFREFGQEASKRIKEMRVGEVTAKPIRMNDGRYVIVKLVAKRASAPLSFNEVKPMLVMQLTNEKFVKMIEDAIKSGKVVFYGLDGKKEAVTTMMPAAQTIPAQKTK